MKKKFEWESVTSCNYCKSTEFLEFMTSDAPSWYSGQPLVLNECAKCGLVFADPRPEKNSINKSYLEGAESARAAVARKLNRPNVLKVHLKHLQTALSFCEDQSSRKRVFDMGCGAGTMMEAARSLDLEAEGNEINLAAIERLRELGFTCYHGFTNEIAELPKNSYDIVINFDYLEHSYVPFEDLHTCHAILRDNGILYLKTLYLDCPDHLMKNDKYQLFGSGHFYYFKPRTLVNMILSAGFEILDIKMGNLIFVVARKPAAVAV